MKTGRMQTSAAVTGELNMDETGYFMETNGSFLSGIYCKLVNIFRTCKMWVYCCNFWRGFYLWNASIYSNLKCLLFELSHIEGVYAEVGEFWKFWIWKFGIWKFGIWNFWNLKIRNLKFRNLKIGNLKIRYPKHQNIKLRNLRFWNRNLKIWNLRI